MHVRLVVPLLVALGLRGAAVLAQERPFQPDENTVLLLHLEGDGNAAGPMHDYFSTLDGLWISLNHDTERKLNRWWSQFDTTPDHRATITHCRALLEKAASLAETPDQRQRIELFSKTFRLREYLFALAAKEKVTRAEGDEVLQYAETVIKPDPMTIVKAIRTSAASGSDRSSRYSIHWARRGRSHGSSPQRRRRNTC